MSPKTISPEKPALRAQLRAARDAFASEGSVAIPAPQAFVDRLSPGMTVASYVPLGSEADPALLTAAASGRGCRIALPHVIDRATPIRFLVWEPGAPLVAGPYGLRQPDPASEEAAPDLILTPLLGYDARFNRLGQGAAHYDRAFARYEAAWRVGVAWSVQELPAIPADIWDVPLHAIITEKGMSWHNA
ncbi:5-formyltetrahydrofolate cyclo-ligase [Sphingomonas soli]|uniref:5-formyltetrahydrofolate cyclo-ligase n=1 Tax=Sphingomonas soli TaxID=266127 RepID=UPI00082F8C18|nr:5-formyltetrahydrofolate cyclo-ligase [Sphingomonas soli]